MSSDLNQRKTYVYLRLGMVLVIVLLFAAIALELWNTKNHCLQESISAYYYTPARSALIGALVTIGACLIIIRGYIDAEDIALNLAGMLAPIVAFVPSKGVGDCRSAELTLKRVDPDIQARMADLIKHQATASIGNSVGALFIVGLVALLLGGVLTFTNRLSAASATPEPGMGRAARRWSFGAAATIVGGLLLWYKLARPSFEVGAHYLAAVLFFVFIAAVVQINAVKDMDPTLSLRKRRNYWRARKNRFGRITTGMALVVVAMVVAKFAFEFDHALLVLEASLIVLFAWFWIVQTYLAIFYPNVPPPTAAPPTASGDD